MNQDENRERPESGEPEAAGGEGVADAVPAPPEAAPVLAPAAVAPRPGVSRGTGRRKTSVARVRVRAGGGTILVNGRPFDQYFPSEQDRVAVLAPLKAAELAEGLDIFVRVEGGGLTGQSGAVRLGVARALREYNPALDPLLRRGGWLTRDARRKERKHYGRRGARRSVQWTKR